MNDDSTPGGPGEEALQAALARHREQLARMLGRIEAAHQAGHLTGDERDAETAAAAARFERDCELATIEADFPGWHCWVGVIPMLYARRPNTSPPWVVRAPDPASLRKAIEAYPGEHARARAGRTGQAAHRAQTGCGPAAPCTDHDPGSNGGLPGGAR